MKLNRLIFFLFICILSTSAPIKMVAQSSDSLNKLENTELENRARNIGKKLRCVVCQNQTIDESDAKIATDLKKIIRDELKKGKSDQEIIDNMQLKYGDFVLMNPPLKQSTYGLWFAPFILFIIGSLCCFFYLKRQRDK